MHRLSISSFIVLCLASRLALIQCHRNFQNMIPNGDRVPHPCVRGKTWLGVGHQSAGGGGARNQFGKDFRENGQKWTKAFCRKDSDGDGLSNGEELGDPDCHWKSGEKPDVTDINKLSHPGICTPWNSPACMRVTEDTEWITRECENRKAGCPAIEDKDIIKETIQLPNSRVPRKTTTYMCMDYIIKSNGTLHMVATTPIIGEPNVVHHMLLFGCHDDNRAFQSWVPGVPYECGMLPSCQGNIISMWAYGMESDCSYNNVGFRVGSTGYTRLALQVHWNNRFQSKGYKDSSGMTLYLTKRLRDYDAGVWVIGSVYLNIPPHMPSYVTQATCAPECTGVYMSGPVNITGLLHHMHYLGQSMKVEVIRQGERFLLAEEKHYDYDNPNFQSFKKPFEVLPGDELLTTCEFNSVGTNATTHWGESTTDEMCFAFVTYFPEQHVRESLCYSWGMVPRCYGELDIPFRGCDYVDVLKRGNSGWLGKVFKRLRHKCDVSTCRRKTCIPVVRKMKTNPCLHGEIYNFIRLNIGESMDKFHQLYTSCDGYITVTDTPLKNRETSNSVLVLKNTFLYVLCLFCCVLLSL